MPHNPHAELPTADPTALAERYNLHLDEVQAVQGFVDGYRRAAALGEEAPAPLDPTEGWLQQLALFAAPAAAEAAVVELFAAWQETAVAPFDFLARVSAVAPRGARPNLGWIRGKAHERVADTLAAEAAFLGAESLDPDCWLALFDLARCASDRGDADRALTLLRRAGVPADDPHVALLTSFRTPERTLGRNDPCWCGSGRKYKVCHLGNESLSLLDRAPWLHHKVTTYLSEEDWHAQALDLAAVLAGIESLPDAEDNAELLEQLAWSPMVLSSLMFEDDALSSFLTDRGMLLPADEQELVAAWIATPRSVHEVLATSPDGITVRNLRDGTELTVWDPHAGAHLPVGFLLSARFLPVGEEWIGFGGYEPLGDDEAEPFLARLDSIDNAADWLVLVADRRAEDAAAAEADTED